MGDNPIHNENVRQKRIRYREPLILQTTYEEPTGTNLIMPRPIIEPPRKRKRLNNNVNMDTIFFDQVHTNNAGFINRTPVETHATLQLQEMDLGGQIIRDEVLANFNPDPIPTNMSMAQRRNYIRNIYKR